MPTVHACVCGVFRAMRSCLSLCDVDENAAASLTRDMESLETEIHQLEQAWKDSVLTSPAARHQSRHDVCQPSANCASDEVTAADGHSRHPCDSIMSTHSDVPAPAETDIRQLKSDSLYSDSGVSVETQSSLCTCRQLVEDTGAVKSDTLQHSLLDCHVDDTDTDRHGSKCASVKPDDLMEQFMLPASVATCFTDPQWLSEYKSCCSKLQQLFNMFQSVSR